MATEFRIFRQTGTETTPPATAYGNIIILKNGGFYTVDELNKTVKIGPFDEAQLKKHLNDAVIHVTQEDRDRWDNVEMALVFDTELEMREWVTVPENIVKLPAGFNFLIRDPDVPDFWWDGTEAVEASTAKVDLTEYLKTAEAQNMFVAKVAGSRLMTDTEAAKLAGIEAGAQTNIIETVRINGIIAAVTNKIVDITVPTLDVIDF